MKYTRYFLCLLSFFITIRSVNAQQQEDISYLSSGGRLHPLQENMDIRHYDIRLAVDIAKRSIAGTVVVDIITAKTADSLMLDLIHFYTVTAVKVDGKTVGFTHLKDRIFIASPSPLAAGRHRVSITYYGKPPVAVRPPWLGGFTWEKDRDGMDWISINCQKEGGRIYFPCKDHPGDEPNEGADLYITVPAHLTVAGPGLLKETTQKKGTKTYHWKTDYTISNYCIVFNIGNYSVYRDRYQTINGHDVPVEFYVLAVDSAQARKVIETRKRDTRILEKYFGEYPWYKEKIGIAEVPNSGMEHQTMITFDNKFRYEKVGEQDYSANLLHEFAHEWWANKVTNRDWAHMWIQEGIGTYAEALTFYELGGQAAYDKIISGHRRGVKNRKPMVMAEGYSEDETYSGGDIYGKGSFFMHSLRHVIGDEAFFKGLMQLATDSAYTYEHFVGSDDVEKLFSGLSGKVLKPFFDFYLRTTDVLDIQIKETGFHKYQVMIKNHFMDLPFDILTDKGIQHLVIPKEGLVIETSQPPLVDPGGNYLKKVTTW
jgi:aminopeptidase N